MQKFFVSLLMALVIPCLFQSTISFADDEYPISTDAPTGLKVGAGIGAEYAKDQLKVLIAAQFEAASTPGDKANVTTHYLWVYAQAGVSTTDQSANQQFRTLDLHIVPWFEQTDRTPIDAAVNHGYLITETIRNLPVEVRRDLDLGIHGKYSFRVVGWTGEWRDVRSDYQTSMVTKFAKVAVDAIGIQMLYYGSPAVGSNRFFGFEPADAEAQTGLDFALAAHAVLRLSIGVKADVAFGSSQTSTGDSGDVSFASEYSLYTRLELIFKNLYARNRDRKVDDMRVYLEGGIRGFKDVANQSSIQPVIDYTDQTTNLGFSTSYGYLALGLSWF